MEKNQIYSRGTGEYTDDEDDSRAPAGDRSTGSGSAKTEVKDQTRSMAAKASESAKKQVSQQKASAAGQIENVGRALHQTSENLRDQQQDKMASVINDAAGQVDRLSGYLRERSVEQLIGDVRDFARKDPGVFLGGAALLGMLGARFLRSSSHSDGTYTQTDHGYDYDPSSDGYQDDPLNTSSMR